MEWIHFWLLQFDLAEHEHVPPNIMGHDGTDFADSVRIACIGWFATIVDQSKDGINVFNLWRRLFPKHLSEIEKVWREIEPQMDAIKEFRDRVAFHADKPTRFFAARAKIRGNEKVAAAMQSFMTLEAFLLRQEEKDIPDFSSVAEELLLDMESSLRISINREWFKRVGILSRERFTMFFG